MNVRLLRSIKIHVRVDINMEQNNNTDTGDTLTPSHLNPHPAVREQMINTAVTFLQNSNVARSTVVQKQTFLRSKGLTEDEIQVACERAGVFTKDPNSSTVINMGITHHPHPQHHHHQTPAVGSLVLSPLQKIKDILSSTALFAGVVYAIYVVYKRFIEPLLFRRDDKKKSVEEQIETMHQQIDQNIGNLSEEVRCVRDDFRKLINNENLLHGEMMTFKNDLDAIKGLLLNRKQFSSPIVPPSIPAWQLQSQRNGGKTDEVCSADGSGSSEAEVVLKNSDSSLEIIS